MQLYGVLSTSNVQMITNKKHIIMKRILILLAAFFALSLYMSAQEKDSIPATNGALEYEDVYDTGAEKTTTKTLSTKSRDYGISDFWRFSGRDSGGEFVIAVLGIVLAFGFPIFVIFIAFYFQYKNRKAKYKLAEQALAAGQPVPEIIIKKMPTNLRTRGIKRIFVGLGLFIFLWAITGEFGVGSIGLLIMCVGFGEFIISRSNENKENK